MNDQLQFDDEEVPITLRRAWDRALRCLAARVNKPTFETHIRAIKPLGMSDQTENGRTHCAVVLGVPSAFTREWVEKRHTTVIAQVLEEILDCDVRVTFTLTPRDAGPPPPVGTAPHGGGPNRPAAGGGNAATAQIPAPFVPFAYDHETAQNETAASGDLFGGAAVVPEAVVRQPVAAGRSEHGAAWEESVSLPPPASVPASGPPAFLPVAPPIPPYPHASAQTPAQGASSRPQHRASGNNGQSRPAPASGASSASSGGSAPANWEAGTGAAAGAPTLNSRYTFDNFVVGQSNRLAQAGAQAVAQAPGAVYNPLFLYGPSGLGKTHLMHAIGNEIMKTQGGNPARVAFVSGEAFTTHFIASLRTGKAEDFRRKWRSVDLWLVDDIQFIAGKESTKEEFFHTFNALYQTGKQIVISSDRSPRELRTMDERLRSRFECGLIADIAAPDLETRLAILHKKADGEHARIPDDVLLYMAQLVQSNIRTLEGALVKLIAYASLVNSPVTTELASSVLERYYVASGMGEAHARLADTDDGPPTLDIAQAFGINRSITGGAITAELVQKVVAKQFGLSEADLAGKKRDKETTNARQIAMHLMRELTELTLLDIGQALGGRDHTTVMYSVDKMKKQLNQDDAMKRMMDELMLQLRAQASG